MGVVNQLFTTASTVGLIAYVVFISPCLDFEVCFNGSGVFCCVIGLLPSSSLFATRLPYKGISCILHVIECILEYCLQSGCYGMSRVILEDVINNMQWYDSISLVDDSLIMMKVRMTVHSLWYVDVESHRLDSCQYIEEIKTRESQSRNSFWDWTYIHVIVFSDCFFESRMSPTVVKNTAYPPPFDVLGIPDSIDDVPLDDIHSAHPLPTPPTFTFPSHVILDGLPIVSESKREKLVQVLRNKILKPYAQPLDFHLPVNEKGESKGYAFLEFPSKHDAEKVVRGLNGFRMDKQHVLTAYPMDGADHYLSVEDVHQEQQVDPWEPKEHLRSWLLDPGARDQLVAVRDEEVAVFYNQKQKPGQMSDAPEMVHSRKGWTESYVMWSPLGSYLATFHKQGVALWGGASWNKIVRFYHPNCKLASFSPKESYLVTWSQDPIKVAGPAIGVYGPEDEGHQFCVWDVHSGRLLRSFPQLESSSKFAWPIFKWSPTEKYIARVQEDVQISVYELPAMGLMDKKSIKIEGVKDFDWMPMDMAHEDSRRNKFQDVIAFWTPEIGNQPARVTLMSLPNKEILRTKNLFNVSECKLYWHPQGDYLCVKVDRHTKSKKSMFTNLELFHMNAKEIPVEVVELKEVVITFAWEPMGSRFCIISAMDQNTVAQGGAAAAGGTPRTIVQFYGQDPNPGPKQGTYRVIKSMDRKQVNAINWCPKGRFCVLWTMRTQTVWDLEFWDMDFEPVTSAIAADKAAAAAQKVDQAADPGAWCQLINTQEHFGLTDVEWDPTGRFVLTSGSYWRQTMENGFGIWDATGRPLYKRTIEKFKQVIWRPRPANLLTKEDMSKIRKNLGKYSKTFDEEDRMLASASSAKALAERDRLLREWRAWRERVTRELARDREEYGMEDDNANVDDGGDEIVEEWVEEVVEETEEIIED